MAETLTSTICTFFRQNAIALDEPPFDCPVPVHVHELTHFTTEEVGEVIDESESYYESTTVVLEHAKILYAPKFGMSYNSFNGCGRGSIRGMGIPAQGGRSGPTRREHATRRREIAMESRTPSSFGEVVSNSSLLDRIRRIEPYDAPITPTSQSQGRGENPELISQWARSMAEDPPRRRSQRSLSPVCRSTRDSGRSARSLCPLLHTEVSVHRSHSGSSTRMMETGVEREFYGEDREVERTADMEVEPESGRGSLTSPAVPLVEIASTGNSPLGTVPSPIHM